MDNNMWNLDPCVRLGFVHKFVYDLTENELQLILDSIYQNTAGNKQVLLDRTLSLLSTCSSMSHNLIQEIVQVYVSRIHQQSAQHLNERPIVHHTQSSIGGQNCIQRQTSVYHEPVIPPTFHNSIQAPLINIPQNKTIQFEHLPFFKEMQTLLEPMHCQTNIDGANITGLYYFTDSIRHSIVNSWNIFKQAFKIQIILRFFQIEHKENVTERLPYNLTVSVNGSECKLPSLNISTNPGITPWRNNVPIDITQHSDLRNCLQNELKITWSQEPLEYMAGVYVVEQMTSDELLVKLKEKPFRKYEKTKELIKKSMENESDMGIDSMFAALQDPLSKTRMKLPARGMHCIHLQCFDAIQFLQMNEHKQSWACPLCKKKVNFEDIEVDEFFLNILQSPNLSKQCENVILLKDGSWSEKKNKGFSSTSVSNSLSKNQVEVVTLSDTDEEDSLSVKRKKYIPWNEKEPVIKSEHVSAETNYQTKSNNTNSPENDLVLDLNIKNGPIASTSAQHLPSIKFNGHSIPSKPSGSSSAFSDFYPPSITISENNSNNSKASFSGTNKNNKPQEKDKSRSVICVITLD